MMIISRRWLLAILLAAIACQGSSPEVRDISQQELLESPPADALILDVRTAEEYAGGHVPGAVHIPYDELPRRIAELGADTNRPLVVYCESGRRTTMAISTLQETGRTNILHLEGDMRAWREADRPTVRADAGAGAESEAGSGA